MSKNTPAESEPPIGCMFILAITGMISILAVATNLKPEEEEVPQNPLVAEVAQLKEELRGATERIISQQDTIETLTIDVRLNKQAKDAMRGAFVECQKVISKKRHY